MKVVVPRWNTHNVSSRRVAGRVFMSIPEIVADVTTSFNRSSDEVISAHRTLRTAYWVTCFPKILDQ